MVAILEVNVVLLEDGSPLKWSGCGMSASSFVQGMKLLVLTMLRLASCAVAKLAIQRLLSAQLVFDLTAMAARFITLLEMLVALVNPVRSSLLPVCGCLDVLVVVWVRQVAGLLRLAIVTAAIVAHAYIWGSLAGVVLLVFVAVRHGLRIGSLVGHVLVAGVGGSKRAEALQVGRSSGGEGSWRGSGCDVSFAYECCRVYGSSKDFEAHEDE